MFSYHINKLFQLPIFRQPKFHKVAGHVGDSGQSSLSATIDDGRFGGSSGGGGRKTVSSSGDLHPPQPTELQNQLSVIHEDDHGTDLANGKDEKRGSKKKSFNKSKSKNKNMTENHAGSEVVDAAGRSDGDVVGVKGDNVGCDKAKGPCNEVTGDNHDSDEVRRRCSAKSATTSNHSEMEVNKSQTLADDGGTVATSATLCPVVMLTPSDTPDSDRHGGKPAIKPPNSRRSSAADISGSAGGGSANKRTSSVISASNSIGSGLDDDDLIDPNRDVGIAVEIRGAYFAWQPEPTEAILSDIDFRADAGMSTMSCVMPMLHIMHHCS